MFVPDRFKTNAYRVLRLSAEATLSEVHKAAGDMRRAAVLDTIGTTDADVPVLGEVPRSEGDIRGAVGRIENPELRIADRLFWFHALQGARDTIPSLNKHDAALRVIFDAFADHLNEEAVWKWARALRSWHEIVSDDEYWSHVFELETEGDFEPAAYPSEIEELRSRAVELAGEPLVIGGREALARNDAAVVRLVLFTLEQLADTGNWASLAQQDISVPLVERFKKLCRSIREEFESRIVREPQVFKQNIETCRAELARFRTDVEPELNRTTQMLPPGYESAQEVREEAALLLSSMASDFTWADEFIESEKLNEEALKLAQDTLGSIRIQARLEEVRASAQKQRMFGKPINSAPSLGSINGVGFTVYGHSDHDPETHSYSTTHYFIVLFLPILPLGRYRVIPTGGRSYRFLGKIPFRSFDRWHLGISLSAIAIAIVMMIANSNGASANSPETTSPSGYSPSAPSTSTDSPGTDTSSTSGTSGPSDAAAPTTTPSTASPDSDPNGAALKSLRERIESGRSQMTEIENRLKPVTDELNSIDQQMEPIKSEIDSLKREKSEGIDINTDHYNSLVDDYNSLLRKKRALIEANSADFDAYENLRKEDASMMEQWKALGGKVE